MSDKNRSGCLWASSRDGIMVVVAKSSLLEDLTRLT
jgi:hypothetical protein